MKGPGIAGETAKFGADREDWFSVCKQEGNRSDVDEIDPALLGCGQGAAR